MQHKSHRSFRGVWKDRLNSSLKMRLYVPIDAGFCASGQFSVYISYILLTFKSGGRYRFAESFLHKWLSIGWKDSICLLTSISWHSVARLGLLSCLPLESSRQTPIADSFLCTVDIFLSVIPNVSLKKVLHTLIATADPSACCCGKVYVTVHLRLLPDFSLFLFLTLIEAYFAINCLCLYRSPNC